MKRSHSSKPGTSGPPPKAAASAPKVNADIVYILGYIANVSPIKQGAKSQYFEAQMLTDNGARKHIGFSPSKRSILKEIAVNKTGIKINKVKKTLDMAGSDRFVMSDSAQITPTALDFEYPEGNTFKELDFTNLEQSTIASEYVINVSVIRVGPQEATDFRNMPKQDAVIAARAHHITLRLWGDLCNKLEPGKSYKICPVKLWLRDNRYLTTTPNTEISTIPDIHVNIPENIHEIHLEKIVTGRIVSVKESQAFLKCPTCNLSIYATDDDEVIQCGHCKSSTLRELCNLGFTITFSIKEMETENILQPTTFKEPLNYFTQYITDKSFNELFGDVKTTTKTLLKQGDLTIEYSPGTHQVLKLI